MHIKIKDAVNSVLSVGRGASLDQIVIGIFVGLCLLFFLVAILSRRQGASGKDPIILSFYIPVVLTMILVIGLVDAFIGLMEGRWVLLLFSGMGFYTLIEGIKELWQQATANWAAFGRHRGRRSLSRTMMHKFQALRFNVENWLDTRYKRRVYLKQLAIEQAKLDAIRIAENANAEPAVPAVEETK